MLLNALVSHVKPMLNRLAYRIVIHNPLLDEIRKEFAAVLTSSNRPCCTSISSGGFRQRRMMRLPI
ncbi:PRD domain-containing protein [Pantoea ananatis]|uniref:PRD domain-containing protein n=1 Tax=Pantoea ananas TaxID=553 RepID=UPI0021A9FF33|nr:PRD domain-containing protein [Pantoea ananatis]